MLKTHMNIAFVTLEYPPFIIGGAGIYIEAITRELIKLGHKVTIFTPNVIESNSKTIKNLDIVRINVNKNIPFKAFQFWLELPKVLKDKHKTKKFDLIHFNGLSYWFFKRKLINIPQVITIHHTIKNAIISNKLSILSRIIDLSGENSIFIPLIEKRAIKSVDKIIADSKFTKKQIIKFYGLKPSEINVIRLGTEKKYKNYNINIRKFKHENKLPDKKMILFVGRINDTRKGLDVLINSFQKVLDRTDAILVIIGEGDKSKFEEISKKLNIIENIFFMGYVDNNTLNKFYQSCDVYVTPSRLEGFGLTILEAISNGAPIIASNVSAIPEIIEDGKNGLLVTVDDPNQLAKAIHCILNNKELRDKIKLNNKIYELPNWYETTKEIQSLYYSLIG